MSLKPATGSEANESTFKGFRQLREERIKHDVKAALKSKFASRDDQNLVKED